MQRGNIFEGLPRELAREQVATLFERGTVRVERIVSRGHTSPETGWYDQEQDEWVVLLQGRARIEFEDAGEMAMAAGDWVLIRAHVKHRVTYTSSDDACVWLAVYVKGDEQDK